MTNNITYKELTRIDFDPFTKKTRTDCEYEYFPEQTFQYFEEGRYWLFYYVIWASHFKEKDVEESYFALGIEVRSYVREKTDLVKMVFLCDQEPLEKIYSNNHPERDTKAGTNNWYAGKASFNLTPQEVKEIVGAKNLKIRHSTTDGNYLLSDDDGAKIQELLGVLYNEAEDSSEFTEGLMFKRKVEALKNRIKLEKESIIQAEAAEKVKAKQKIKLRLGLILLFVVIFIILIF
jgi:hypothetical protein